MTNGEATSPSLVLVAGFHWSLVIGHLVIRSHTVSTQTYCLRADVEAAWTPADSLAAVDDDASSTISVDEEAIVTRAIERAANRMNAALEMRYSLEPLADNDWCRDCNAAIAAYLLATRRGDAASDVIQ